MRLGASRSVGNAGRVLITLGSLVAGMLFARVVYAKKIDKRYVRLKGCGDAFLNDLLPFSGAT